MIQKSGNPFVGFWNGCIMSTPFYAAVVGLCLAGFGFQIGYAIAATAVLMVVCIIFAEKPEPPKLSEKTMNGIERRR